MLSKRRIRPNIFIEEKFEMVVEWIEKDHYSTLIQLHQKLMQNFQRIVFASRLPNYMEGRLLTIDTF